LETSEKHDPKKHKIDDQEERDPARGHQREHVWVANRLAQAHRNICATGDPDQSIYAWRGADLNNILDFENDYSDARVVRLEQNFRSTGAILAAASELISCNDYRKHKRLWTAGEHGGAVRGVPGGVELILQARRVAVLKVGSGGIMHSSMGQGLPSPSTCGSQRVWYC